MAWSLDEILSNSVATLAFRMYMKRIHAEESLDFADAIAKYRERPHEDVARQIYDKYVADNAPRQASLSAASKQAIESTLARAGLFDEAVRVVNQSAERRLTDKDFVRAVANYRLRPSNATARSIYADYVSDNAARKVNLPGQIKAGIEEGLPRTEPAGKDRFNRALNDVRGDLDNMLKVFVTTPEGKPYSVSAEDLGKGFAAIGAAEKGTGGDISRLPDAPDPLPVSPPRSGGDGDLRGEGTDDDAERDDEKKDFADE